MDSIGISLGRNVGQMRRRYLTISGAPVTFMGKLVRRRILARDRMAMELRRWTGLAYLWNASRGSLPEDFISCTSHCVVVVSA